MLGIIALALIAIVALTILGFAVHLLFSPLVLVAIIAVLLARGLVLVLPGLLPARVLQTTHAERMVLAWGGLRGALTITLALALPAETPARQLLIEMAYGVVLFTLLVQGLTLSLALRRAGLSRASG